MIEVFIVLLGAIGVIAVIAIYGAFSWGLVFYKFYHWFILPIFTELPQIDFWQAVGMSLFLVLFKNHSAVKNEDDKTDWGTFIISPWIILGVGYLIYSII